MMMEQFDLTRQAAVRQFTRHILPEMTKDGMNLAGEGGAGDGDDDDWMERQSLNSSDQQLHHDQNENQDTVIQQQQPARSIVISGVTSGRGRALLEYYSNHGHFVAGCGRSRDEIQSLQIQFPQSNLRAIDVTNDQAVSQWALELDDVDVDLIITNSESCPEEKVVGRNVPAWEVACDDFDTTIDMNVKGLANMVRHFIPKLIRMSNVAGISGGVRKERVFVALLSSTLGGQLDPYRATCCAVTFAIKGFMKCVAMSIPEPLCAITLDPSSVEGPVKHDAIPRHDGKSGWVDIAGPMLLQTNRDSNGKSLSIQHCWV